MVEKTDPGTDLLRATTLAPSWSSTSTLMVISVPSLPGSGSPEGTRVPNVERVPLYT